MAEESFDLMQLNHVYRARRTRERYFRAIVDQIVQHDTAEPVLPMSASDVQTAAGRTSSELIQPITAERNLDAS